MNSLENLSLIKKLSGMPTVESIVERIRVFLENYPNLADCFDGDISMFLESYKNNDLIIINGDYYNEYYTIRFIGTGDKDDYIMFPFEIIDSDSDVYCDFISQNSSLPVNFESASINCQKICDELSAVIGEMEERMRQITGVRKYEEDKGN